MESDTIAKALEKYAIGAKLRRLRLRKSMGLVELGKHTGLSPALLSKLERDLMRPTLATLVRIALVFSVELDFFFTPEPRPVLEIVRKRERLKFPDAPDAAHPSYVFECLDFRVAQRALNAYWAEFEQVESGAHQHPGVEFLYVISGKLELLIGEDRHELAEGDAVYFESTVLHSYCRSGSKRATVLVVTAGA